MAELKDRLTGALQENVLTLLCFDDGAASVISKVVDVGLFESSLYRAVAEKATAFYREHKEAPKDHLPDILEPVLETAERAERKALTRLMKDLRSTAGGVNRKYVLSTLEQFVDQQSLRISITSAANHLRSGKVDDAKQALATGMKRRVAVFQRGTSLKDAVGEDSFYDSSVDVIPTGIAPLDANMTCPARGELFTFLAPPNRGKTWFLGHIGKSALLSRHKVLHVTLEMSELKIARRYAQSFLSMTKRDSDFIRVPEFKRDRQGGYTKLEFRELKNRPSLTGSKRSQIARKIRRLRVANNLIIKQFPTGHLTIEALSAYLDMLEEDSGFMPDMLLLDYADLMRIDTTNLRAETGNVYKELRGLMVERNIAGVTATQSNRQGEDARVISLKHLSEDYSKAFTSDIVVSYNQTPDEKALGLARLFEAKVRDEASGGTTIISQAYGIGQFCMDAVSLRPEYWRHVDANRARWSGDEDDDDVVSPPSAKKKAGTRRKTSTRTKSRRRTTRKKR